MLASLQRNEVGYDPLVEKFKYDFFGAKDITSMEKKSSSTSADEADPVGEQGTRQGKEGISIAMKRIVCLILPVLLN